MKKYKVGIVGAGGVTELHFVGYKEHPERIEITALCDPNPEALHAKADKYGVPQRFTDLQDFIQNSGIDVAVVCTPTSIRKQIVFPLLEAGLPVFVEKPFSDTLAEATEITEKAQQLGVPISINQNFRRHFPFELIKNKIAEGIIGKVTSILFTNLFFRQDVGWRLECERNALSVMGIHWFDGFRQILGSEAVSVVCQNRSSSAIHCVGETDATVQVVFENNAVATYVQSFSSTINRTEMIVIGETGTIVTLYNKVDLYRKGEKAPSETWDNQVSREVATYEGLNHLLTSLETGVEAPNSSRDNLNTISILDAAYVSANEQRIVQLKHGVVV
ncbi:Gfo/Idh/MocA family protein [Paenibacillus radicis (ex Xue et al. 2023)]|uniref:Gfo/Idh/MocA family oxidoreductase n=1 Tax=Paenibacillus radicis (ex Xue et al. 2023) TaxID=2972489 RepID=A0ABT1YT85_9BACL|nr:Gfo/Idh/MocA family oxidoreductase [Paenibacillus radicis (ex Xue et al. 2023)]MCR8635518.1 Gfo/Idh/MocA family oxidoreductase [Paenibacillus radicis (ex Xue et al. 2023)]